MVVTMAVEIVTQSQLALFVKEKVLRIAPLLIVIIVLNTAPFRWFRAFWALFEGQHSFRYGVCNVQRQRLDITHTLPKM